MIKRVLVSNRGEIALRIINNAKQLGIETVLVCSSEDRESVPSKSADKVVCIGPPASAKSYLHQESIIQTALSFGCDSIHPGYGFLSENKDFAKKCEDNGIIFIGPDADTIGMMGDKMTAKRIMIDNGIPTVPGSENVVDNIDEAKTIAERIGYPVLIKASSGGGGRGMRIAYSQEEFCKSFDEAKKEAKVSFENDDLYIEKFIDHPRHIEVQILADGFGNTIHLGTRDCSLQRRHQKVIEEAPACSLSDKLRDDICNTAVRVARLIKYKNAGTVEFILDKDDNYYFIEVNTRIQVEHPVSEMITGVNLIKEQFMVASGKRLDFTQKEISFNGVSIECRVNAENTNNNFSPCPGLVKKVIFPDASKARVDTFIQSGSVISPWYDSMIAKIIVHAADRKSAVSKMKDALNGTTIEGIRTNLSFLSGIMDDEKYQNGDVNTGFIEYYLSDRESTVV